MQRPSRSVHRVAVLVPVGGDLLAGLYAWRFAGHLRVVGFSGHFNPVRFQVHPPFSRRRTQGPAGSPGLCLGSLIPISRATSSPNTKFLAVVL